MDRREFLYCAGGTLAVGSGVSGVSPLLQAIAPVHAAQAEITPELVRFTPEMESVVRWIEQTPREKILDAAVDHLKAGLPYRMLLGATFLAGIRNIRPRPVGFKFHAVLAIPAIHQLVLDAPQEDRLLPLFYALDGSDGFKRAQELDSGVNDWSLGAVKESAVPHGVDAPQRFREAMEKWDADAADGAIVALARTCGTAEICEWLWEYGARNFRSIGHNMIYCANAVRTLQTIGWEHAEPVLRSVVFGLLDGESNAGTWSMFEHNRGLVKQIRADWLNGNPDAGAVTAFLDTLRHAAATDASREALEALNRGCAAESLWEAIRLFAAELVMRRPNIISLHAMTSCNAMHYAFRSSGEAQTRLLVLLQAASWMALFREEFARRGKALTDDGPRIDTFEGPEPGDALTVDALFEGSLKDRFKAAQHALTLLKTPGNESAFKAAARHWAYRKADDHHDFKFPVAAFEDYACAGGPWGPRLLAASVCLLKGGHEADSELLGRARQALARL